jgi:hypothetical protein
MQLKNIAPRNLKTVSRLLLIITLTFPLFLTAEEIVISPAYIPEGSVLDLTYNPPLDPYYCDNNPELCKSFETNDIPIFDMTPRATNGQWLAFWTFQLLDVYSTSRALKYNCVKEVNPLFTENPSDARLVLTKTLLLVPGLAHNDYWKDITPDELNDTNMVYSVVVANNFRLLNKAKQECNKIR